MKAFLYILLFFATTINGQNLDNISQLEVKADVAYIKHAIEDASVNPYSCISEKRFHKLLKRAERRISKKSAVTPIDFYTAFQPAIAKLRDGHTELNISDYIYHTDYKEFPFKVELQENSLYIKSITNGYEQYVPKSVIGKRIRKIDHKNSSKIIKLFGLYTSAENKRSSIALSPYYFNDYFNVLLNKNDQLSIDIEDHNELTIKILKKSKIKNVTQQERKFENFSYTLKEDNDYAVLTLNSFSGLESFKTFLTNFFSTLKRNNIENLVIDLRENGGGNSQLGDELLSYLISEPFTQYEKTLAKYSDTQKQYIESLTDAEDQYRQTILEKKSATVETTDKSKILIFPKTIDQRFKGNVLILISGQTFSSAADFANTCKHYIVGTIIGEETGGFVVSAGETIEVSLPHSPVKLNVSTTKDYNVGATEESRHGVKPHINVSASKALDYTLKRIKKLEVSTN